MCCICQLDITLRVEYSWKPYSATKCICTNKEKPSNFIFAKQSHFPFFCWWKTFNLNLVFALSLLFCLPCQIFNIHIISTELGQDHQSEISKHKNLFQRRFYIGYIWGVFNPSLTLPNLRYISFIRSGLAGEDNEKIVHSRNHTISQTHTYNQPYTHTGLALTSSFVWLDIICLRLWACFPGFIVEKLYAFGHHEHKVAKNEA